MWAIAVMALGAPSLERSRRNLAPKALWLRSRAQAAFRFLARLMPRQPQQRWQSAQARYPARSQLSAKVKGRLMLTCVFASARFRSGFAPRNGSVVAWIVDDTGFVKKGTHSVGVVRQYCGQVGKQENCRVAVSLSVATEQASLPIAWRLYLPETWAKDRKRRKEAGIPKEIAFTTKPTIALQQIRQAIEKEVTSAPVLADAAYGNDSQFREGLTELRLAYVVGVQGTTTVWRCGEAPLSAKQWKGLGRTDTTAPG